MTNLDALKANISQVHGLVVSENAFLKALADEEVSSVGTYVKDGEQSIDLATIRIYKQIIGAAGFSEGDVSYSPAQIEGLKLATDNLLSKCGLSPEFNSKPTIRGFKAW
jgi:hypothetical protein